MNDRALKTTWSDLRRLVCALMLMLALGLFLYPAQAEVIESRQALAEIQAFGRQLILQTPFRSFEQKSFTPPEGMISRTQLTPKPDDPLYGRHSVEVIIFDRGAQMGLNAESVASSIRAGSSPFCRPKSVQLQVPASVDGSASFISCPAESHLGGNLAMVHLGFFGPRDLYVVIWTDLVRSPESVDPNDPKWQQRVEHIAPKYFCMASADNPKMVNCISPKKLAKP